jgi:hypothetical protein
MVSNAWDENVTKVEVTLTLPDKNGHCTLRVVDDSATGWANLQHSYTMFAESLKKVNSEKRGRFNAGEKDVLALAIDAKLTTVMDTRDETRRSLSDRACARTHRSQRRRPIHKRRRREHSRLLQMG